jgi:hypothetical protein
MKPKLPAIDSVEAREFCKAWDTGTHIDKLKLCRAYKVDYTQGGNYRSKCKVVELPQETLQVQDCDWREKFRIMGQMDKLVAYHMQYPTEITIRIEADNPIGIINWADLHIGADGFSYENFETDVDFIHDATRLYVRVGGDGYHNIIQTSKIGSSMNQIPICVQKAAYVQILQYLEDKIIAIATGNHNYWTTLAEGEDWDGELARRLKMVYIKHFAKINLVVGDILYPMVVMHKGKFNSNFNLTHTCKQYQRMYFPDARVVVIEHQHTAAMEEYRYNDNECIAIRTGTYHVYDDYAMQNGFFGSHVSNPTVVFYPDRDKMVGFKDMRDSEVYLRGI